MELTPEEDLSTASKAVLQMVRMGRDAELTDQDRRSLGDALRHAAWESQTELEYQGIQGGIMQQRLIEMAEMIGGPASKEETELSGQIAKEWEKCKADFPTGVPTFREILERI